MRSFIAGTKLDSDTCTEYKSGSSSPKANAPSESVADFSRRRSSLLNRDTIAPGWGLPPTSVTRPPSSPENRMGGAADTWLAHSRDKLSRSAGAPVHRPDPNGRIALALCIFLINFSAALSTSQPASDCRRHYSAYRKIGLLLHDLIPALVGGLHLDGVCSRPEPAQREQFLDSHLVCGGVHDGSYLL